MPELEKPRDEAYAQAIARGLPITRAGREAGFARGSYTRLKNKLHWDQFKARVEELERAAMIAAPTPDAMLNHVLVLAQEARKKGTPTALGAAGRLVLQAARFKMHRGQAQDEEREDDEPSMALDEWYRTYGPKN